MANGTETYSYTYLASFPGFPPGGPSFVIRSDEPSIFITCNLTNPDYQTFLAWIAAGGVPPTGWTGPKS